MEMKMDTRGLGKDGHEEHSVIVPDSVNEAIENDDTSITLDDRYTESSCANIPLAFLKREGYDDITFLLNFCEKPLGFTNTTLNCALNANLQALKTVRNPVKSWYEEAVTNRDSVLLNGLRDDMFPTERKAKEPSSVSYFNENGFFDKLGSAVEILGHILEKVSSVPEFKNYYSSSNLVVGCRNGHRYSGKHLVNLEKCQECKGPIEWVDPSLCESIFAELHPYEQGGDKVNRRHKELDIEENIEKSIASNLRTIFNEFEVTSFVNHEGPEAKKGHFTCFAKSNKGNWYKCDDELVCPLINIWDSIEFWFPCIIVLERKNV